MNRRSFLHSLGALVPAAALGGCAESGAAGVAQAGLDPVLLGALAEAVLPTELGAEGVVEAASAFRTWVDGFEPVAELNHGYGTGEIRFAAADPAPGWGAQLRALDLQARRTAGRGFAELAPEERREVVRGQIEGDRVDRLPDPAEARHVAVGLLAHFYATPEATDLCYRADIGRNRCRPLDRSPRRPDPLQPRA